MGITVHYQGRISDPANISELIARLKNACRVYDWQFTEINERLIGTVERLISQPDPEDEQTVFVASVMEPLDDRWHGIVIWPPDCESLCFTFNRAGRLAIYHAQFNSSPGNYWLQESLGCKTQFSTLETHIAICSLLRLVEPYMADWEVYDDGNFWETGDLDELKRRMEEIGKIISDLANDKNLKSLEEITGAHVEGKTEIGKQIFEVPPPWREHWGESANEN